MSPVSINGVTDHVHHPCPRCGFATRYKQWPIGCLCNKYEPHHRTPEPCRTGPGADGKLTCLTHARTPARHSVCGAVRQSAIGGSVPWQQQEPGQIPATFSTPWLGCAPTGSSR